MRPFPASLRKNFSKSATLFAKRDGKYDSSDPLHEDSAKYLAKDFKNDPEGLEQHFSEKESSINSLKDSEETGELEDITQEELQRWEAQRLELLRTNEEVKENTYQRIEMGIASESESDSESSSCSSSQSESANTTSGNFPQDTSDIVRDDFTSFDNYEE